MYSRRGVIHIFINALAASSGGGLTYVRNIMPRLAVRDDVRTTVLLSGVLRGEIAESARATVLQSPSFASSGRRFWHEQRKVPDVIRSSGADVLLCTGNFAL